MLHRREHGSKSSVQNLTKANTLICFKNLTTKSKRLIQRAELLHSFIMMYSTVLGSEHGLVNQDALNGNVSGRRLYCSSRLKLISERLHLLPQKLVSSRQRSLNSLVLSVLSPTMQLSSQGILATLNLSKNRGFEK